MLRARRIACAALWTRSASFVGNICQGKIDPAELFPFPTSALPDHVKDSMVEARSAASAKDSVDAWGLLIPDHFGGQGFPHPCVFDVVSHMSPERYSAIHSHTLISFLIRSFASKEHMGRYLPGMSDSTLRVGWAADEFASPNDPCGKATANFLDAKASFEVTCSKVVSSDADPTAFALLCNINKGDRKQLGWIFVERGQPGATFENGVLTLDKAIVPMDNVFIGQGDGYRSSMTAVLTGQYLSAACVAQLARSAALNAPAAVSIQLHAEAYAVESCAAALAANIEKGVADTFMESSLLSTLSRSLFDKVRSNACDKNVGAAIEGLLAGIAPLGKAAACCGIEDMAQIFTATSTLEMMQIRTARMVGLIDRFPALEADAEAVKRCESLIVTFGESIEKIAVRQGVTAVDREILLGRSAEVGALLFASAAVLSRVHRGISGKIPTVGNERGLANVWCTMALDRVDALLSVTGATSADSAHARIAADLLAE